MPDNVIQFAPRDTSTPRERSHLCNVGYLLATYAVSLTAEIGVGPVAILVDDMGQMSAVGDQSPDFDKAVQSPHMVCLIDASSSLPRIAARIWVAIQRRAP